MIMHLTSEKGTTHTLEHFAECLYQHTRKEINKDSHEDYNYTIQKHKIGYQTRIIYAYKVDYQIS